MRIPCWGERQEIVEEALADEEQRFATTLTQGMALLNRHIEDLDGKVIGGDVVFRLYDTFGFPADLTADVARESGLGIDQEGFDRLMEEQRARGRAASGRFSADIGQRIRVDSTVDFQGYEAPEGAARVVWSFPGRRCRGTDRCRRWWRERRRRHCRTRRHAFLCRSRRSGG